MSPTDSLDHRRTHNLLLIARLLSLRDDSSPLTLLLDSLSQSAKPLVQEYLTRASASKRKTIYVSSETFTLPPRGIDVLLPARRTTPAALAAALAAALPAPPARALIVFDALNTLAAMHPSALAGFLAGLMAPAVCIVAVYHGDVALPPDPDAGYPDTAPAPLTLLRYFATTVVACHSLRHVLAGKAARDRALAPPAFGIEEGREGVVVGLGSSPPEGVVMEMEFRRKSGRGVEEWYFLPADEREGRGVDEKGGGGRGERVILLEDHPRWRESEAVKRREAEELRRDVESGEPRSTFELGITERQKAARDEVVLPYFDAQREGGIGGGGAILFTPDKEIDDFDDEEDEI